MGNIKLFRRSKRKNSRSKQSSVCTTNAQNVAHEGIKTIEVEKLVENSSGSSLRVCVVTWNMNGKKVSSQDLEKLVDGERNFDLLVIGLQEVPRCNMAQLLQEALSEGHSLLGESLMQSLQLFVFGAKPYDHLIIKDIKIDKYDVGGLGGLLGRKKGAVAISITVRRIQMLFISCHLSAHAHNVEERNSQLRDISHFLFSKNQNPYARPPDITVWLGDLNYRIQGLENQPVRNLIQRDLHTELLTSKDQLLQEAERGQIFEGYCEGSLEFKPTYKYDVGSSNYDTSNKVRIPSWTDRILFKTEKSSDLEAELHAYDSIDHIDISDHKPVRAVLSLKLSKSDLPRDSENKFLYP